MTKHHDQKKKIGKERVCLTYTFPSHPSLREDMARTLAGAEVGIMEDAAY